MCRLQWEDDVIPKWWLLWSQWITWLGHQQGKTSTLGSRLVILIEFYIAPKDSQDLQQEAGGVAQERLLCSGRSNKTQVGHSGQGPVTAHLSLRARVPLPHLLQPRGTRGLSGARTPRRDPSQHSNPARGRYCKQPWTGTWEQIHFPVLTERL